MQKLARRTHRHRTPETALLKQMASNNEFGAFEVNRLKGLSKSIDSANLIFKAIQKRSLFDREKSIKKKRNRHSGVETGRRLRRAFT